MSAHRQHQLRSRAAAMRAAPTTTEALLWEQLRGKRLGVVFRRQVVIGRYIADFAAPSVRLVAEVDGGYHRGCAAADARRDRALGRLGWRVLRVSAAEVMAGAEAVAAQVAEALRAEPG